MADDDVWQAPVMREDGQGLSDDRREWNDFAELRMIDDNDWQAPVLDEDG